MVKMRKIFRVGYRVAMVAAVGLGVGTCVGGIAAGSMDWAALGALVPLYVLMIWGAVWLTGKALGWVVGAWREG